MTRRQILKSLAAAALAAVAPIPAMANAEPAELPDPFDNLPIVHNVHVPIPPLPLDHCQSIATRIFEVNKSRTDFEGSTVKWNREMLAFHIKVKYTTNGKPIPLMEEFFNNPDRAAAFLGMPEDAPLWYAGCEWHPSQVTYTFFCEPPSANNLSHRPRKA